MSPSTIAAIQSNDDNEEAISLASSVSMATLDTTKENKEEKEEEEVTATTALQAMKKYKRNRVYGTNNSDSSTYKNGDSNDNDPLNEKTSAHGKNNNNEYYDDNDDNESIDTVAHGMNNDLFQIDDNEYDENDNHSSMNHDFNDAEDEEEESDDDDSSIETVSKSVDLEDKDEEADNKEKEEIEDDGFGIENVEDETNDGNEKDEEMLVNDQTQHTQTKNSDDNDDIMDDQGIEGDDEDISIYHAHDNQDDEVVDSNSDEEDNSNNDDDATMNMNDEESSVHPTKATSPTTDINNKNNSKDAIKKDISSNPSSSDQQRQSLSTRELQKKTKQLFSTFSDLDSITWKQFIRTLEKTWDVKVKDKEQRDFVKAYLGELVDEVKEAEANVDSDAEEGEGEDVESNHDDDSDDEFSSDDTTTPKKKKSTKIISKKKKRKSKTEEDHSDSPITRSQTQPRKTRKPSHVKIHEEMRRKKILQEAKVRQEELQAAAVQKYNEEDRLRAQLISKKFDTNTDEAKIKRIEDRIGLLGKLKQKRLEVITLHEEDLDDDNDLKDANNTDDIVEGDERSGDEEGESSGDDGELEFIDKKQVTSKKKSPTSILDMFDLKSKMSQDKNPQQRNNNIIASFANPRAALRNALRMKQYESGNRWLAKELGYEKPEDHIRECQLNEMKKKKMMVKKEEERMRLVHERNERLKAFVTGDINEDEFIGDAEDGDDNVETATLTNHSENEGSVYDTEPEEENEELAMARAIENEDEQNEELVLAHNIENERLDSDSENQDDADEELVHDFTEAPQTSKLINEEEDDNEEIVNPSTHLDKDVKENELDANNVVSSMQSDESMEDLDEDNKKVETEVKNTLGEGINTDTDGLEVQKRPKNAAWKAMLEKEKELLKKQKAMNKGNAIDDEAEEEEEEEGVVGLEDFGFTVKSKQKGDEENDADDADDEDFENIVDELSDGEGDEEAGDKARKELLAKEEKMRHKEVMRRIREGYDGKRGGVAGGSSMRGNLRFDQLVAADNRMDAKRLGLLNDDELDSEDEDANENEEEEDEEVQLDRMLKERHLNKTDLPMENFSDSEEENESEEDGDGPQNEDDEEDKEQERLAKRFAKRARMNRLLELHGDKKEFSQSRLLDEDEDLRRVLTKIKNVHGRTIRQVSNSSASANSNHSFVSTSNSDSKSSSQDKTSFLPFGSTLFTALSRSRQSNRKTSFLGSSASNNNRSKSTIKSQAVRLGHVVFTEDTNSSSSFSKGSKGGGSAADVSRSSLFPGAIGSKEPPHISRKRSISEMGKSRGKGSLWSKLSSNNGFRKRQKG